MAVLSPAGVQASLAASLFALFLIAPPALLAQTSGLGEGLLDLRTLPVADGAEQVIGDRAGHRFDRGRVRSCHARPP